MTWTTDNRWSPGASGADAPADAPAAYSARWIDMGDNTPADIVPDRQGFAYTSIEDREDLIELLNKAGNHTRTPAMANMVRDMTCILFNHPEWKMYARRAGGYIYVDAWLTPSVPNPPAADVKVVEVPMLITERDDRTWEVRCQDGGVRHDQNFWTLAEAREWADTGHACLKAHTFVEVWS